MKKVIIQKISECWGCPHKSHTGGFTEGGAKACCDNPLTVKALGDNCFNRIIENPDSIPAFCPLADDNSDLIISALTEQRDALLGLLEILDRCGAIDKSRMLKGPIV